MTTTNSGPIDLEKTDLARVLHPNTNLAALHRGGPLVLVRGQGVHVWDNHGRQYIEAMAGLWCTALGWGEERLAEAAAKQMRELPFYHLFSSKAHGPGIRLAECWCWWGSASRSPCSPSRSGPRMSTKAPPRR